MYWPEKDIQRQCENATLVPFEHLLLTLPSKSFLTHFSKVSVIQRHLSGRSGILLALAGAKMHLKLLNEQHRNVFL
jgi:hypothetical protein